MSFLVGHKSDACASIDILSKYLLSYSSRFYGRVKVAFRVYIYSNQFSSCSVLKIGEFAVESLMGNVMAKESENRTEKKGISLQEIRVGDDYNKGLENLLRALMGSGVKVKGAEELIEKLQNAKEPLRRRRYENE